MRVDWNGKTFMAKDFECRAVMESSWHDSSPHLRTTGISKEVHVSNNCIFIESEPDRLVF